MQIQIGLLQFHYFKVVFCIQISTMVFWIMFGTSHIFCVNIIIELVLGNNDIKSFYRNINHF